MFFVCVSCWPVCKCVYLFVGVYAGLRMHTYMCCYVAKILKLRGYIHTSTHDVCIRALSLHTCMMYADIHACMHALCCTYIIFTYMHDFYIHACMMFYTHYLYIYAWFLHTCMRLNSSYWSNGVPCWLRGLTRRYTHTDKNHTCE